jgi:hypothetical protein
MHIERRHIDSARESILECKCALLLLRSKRTDAILLKLLSKFWCNLSTDCSGHVSESS